MRVGKPINRKKKQKKTTKKKQNKKKRNKRPRHRRPNASSALPCGPAPPQRSPLFSHKHMFIFLLKLGHGMDIFGGLFSQEHMFIFLQKLGHQIYGYPLGARGDILWGRGEFTARGKEGGWPNVSAGNQHGEGGVKDADELGNLQAERKKREKREKRSIGR